MSDQPAVHLTNTEGFDQLDLAIALELWRDDVAGATWATRELTKIAVHLARVLSRTGSSGPLQAREIEGACQLEADAVASSFKQLRYFGAIESFLMDKGEVRAVLAFGHLQRLRVFQAREQLKALRLARARGDAIVAAPTDPAASVPKEPARPLVELEGSLLAAAHAARSQSNAQR
ncbi:MAG: hypothetical protein GC150_16235 [Rhizobiales bacterium]|nr:hypothetical protein [Hyphomicrobiales bacterium]